MHGKLTGAIFFFFASCLFLTGCGNKESAAPKKELLVYCGITMIKPVAEIAGIIEEEEDCTITITKGGSGNLLKSLKINNVGDLFLPGAESYIRTCLKEELVSETVHVGYNKAALMVQKGNPKNISSDLNNLVNPEYYVVIGNPESGSIGKETEKILKKKGIFEEVMNKARKLTTDSKDLITVLKEKEADLVVNWYAASTWEGNRAYIDSVPIDEKFAQKKKLVMGLLKTSRYPEIARKMMMLASSPKGRDVFNKYGLYDVP